MAFLSSCIEKQCDKPEVGLTNINLRTCRFFLAGLEPEGSDGAGDESRPGDSAGAGST